MDCTTSFVSDMQAVEAACHFFSDGPQGATFRATGPLSPSLHQQNESHHDRMALWQIPELYKRYIVGTKSYDPLRSKGTNLNILPLVDLLSSDAEGIRKFNWNFRFCPAYFKLYIFPDRDGKPILSYPDLNCSLPIANFGLLVYSLRLRIFTHSWKNVLT